MPQGLHLSQRLTRVARPRRAIAAMARSFAGARAGTHAWVTGIAETHAGRGSPPEMSRRKKTGPRRNNPPSRKMTLEPPQDLSCDPLRKKRWRIPWMISGRIRAPRRNSTRNGATIFRTNLPMRASAEEEEKRQGSFSIQLVRGPSLQESRLSRFANPPYRRTSGLSPKC